MTETEALTQMARLCDLMALCLVHDPKKADQYTEELHHAYRQWFSAWQSRVQDNR